MSDSITISKAHIKKIFLAIFIVGLIAIWTIGFFIYKGFQEKPLVESSATEFIDAVAKNEIQNAYIFLSTEFKNEYTVEKLQDFINSNKLLFVWFKSLSFNSFKVESGTQHVTYYNYSGPINYSNGDIGTIFVRFIKEDGQYKIHYFNITVGPERVKYFQGQE